MKKLILLAAFCGFATFSAPASAQEDTLSQSAPATLGLGVGYYDIFDNDSAADFRVEYRSGNTLFWKIKPWIGAEATTDGTLWGGGGLLADFKLAPNIYVTPSIGAGLYAQGSSDKDLGSALEFRTQLEGGYEFVNGHRVGLALSHISNADIGDDNPGTEVLNLYYHVPVGNLF